MSTKPSCRLTLFIAPEARRAVILRRGPTRWFHLILWSMQSDEFEFGSWFEGRIYEDKCDLSPDGQFFIYFAAKQNPRTSAALGSNAWTAVCQPPWVKPVILEPSTCGTYYGGGNFVMTGEPSFSEAQPETFLPKSIRIAYSKYRTRELVQVEGADSTGLDHRNRVVYSVGGQLWRCKNTLGRVKNAEQIADFSDLTPPDARRNWKPELPQ